MSDRSVVAVIVGAILAVGIVALVGVTQSNTGAMIEDTKQVCKCYIEEYDFYGNSAGIEVHTLQTHRSFISTQAQQCNEACMNRHKVRDGNTLVYGVLEPTSILRRRKPYHEPRAMPSSI